MTSESLDDQVEFLPPRYSPIYATIKKVNKKDTSHSISDETNNEENDACENFMTSYKIKSRGSFSPDRLSEAPKTAAEEPRSVGLTSDDSNMTSQNCDMTLSFSEPVECFQFRYSPDLSTIHEVSEEDTSSSFVDVTLGNDVTIKHNDETASIKSKEYIIIDDDVISLNSDNAHLTFEE